MASAGLFDQFDDESFALQLQLQETEAQRELQSGKWPEDRPPDSVLAFDDFQAELKKAILLVEDLKLAHSIAETVDSDAAAIEVSRVPETQSVQDQQSVLSLNEDENLPSQEVTDLPEMSPFEAENVIGAIEASTSSMESSNNVAGLSADYALRQRAVPEHLPELKLECSVCGEAVHPHATVRLACNDVYYKPCLKSFFLRVAQDESLFPPKCHRQLIDISTIEADFSIDELTAYQTAKLEFTSTDRVYCANPECTKFIPMSQRTADCAYYGVCWGKTCMYCKARAHDGGCPPDKSK